MKRAFLASISGFVCLVTVSSWGRYIKAEEDCRPVAGFHYLCGPNGAEDLVRVPGTQWIIGSGMGENGNAGKLHLIDAENKS